MGNQIRAEWYRIRQRWSFPAFVILMAALPALVALTAYVTADLLRSKPVYDLLLERLLKKRGVRTEAGGEKVLIEVPISHGAAVCGTPIRELSWLGDALVVAVRRHDRELIPHGDTALEAGDVLVLLCEESKSHPVYEAVTAQCKR